MKKLSVFLILLIASCSTAKDPNSKSYSHETECVKDNFDGTYVIKAWGSGSNVNEDIVLAKKNALNDILFRGLNFGKSDCGVIPLVNEPNARQNHEAYFNNFFSDKGDFLKYVEVQAGASVYKNQAVTLIVKKSALKQKLINDGIIKN